MPAPVFSIRTRDPGSYARTGTLKLAHGEVRTPAFVPLATKAVVKTLEVREAAALGYDMVLGNTFHLFLTPGHELIKQLGGLHRVPALGQADHHRLRRLPGLLDGPRHRRRRDQGPRRRSSRGERSGAILAIEEEGVTLPLLPRRLDAVHGPGDLDGGPGRARVRHRARVRRVHPVPRRPRLHRALDRAHAPLARPLPRLARRSTDPRARSSTGSSRAGSRRTCAARPRRRSRRATRSAGSRSAARSARTRRRCSRSSSGRSRSCRRPSPRHLLGIGEVDDLVRGVELGIDTFDCAMPTRIGRHGMALVPDPEKRWRVDLAKARWKRGRRAAARGLPVPRLRGAATPAPTCTTCSRRRSRPRCAC